MNPYLKVICGIIIQERRVLVAQRGVDMDLPLKWEFPGGKKEIGESDVDCLRRELFEELNISISVGKRFTNSIYSYPFITIELIAYFASILEGTLFVNEHANVKWCSRNQLEVLDWAEADRPIVTRLIRLKFV